MSEEKADADVGGFKFAVTLLASLGTILYAVCIYLQNTPLDYFLYLLITALFSVGVVLIVYLLLYILLKGYAIELPKTSKQKERLDNWSSSIYSLTFYISLYFLYCVVSIFVTFYFNLTNPLYVLPLLIISMIAFIFLVIYIFDLRNTLFNRNFKLVLGLFIIAIILFIFLFPTSIPSSLQGHVTVDMESIYYKNDAPIPVLIHVTGPNTNLSVFLVKEESDHNLYLIENITLIPEQKSRYKTVSDRYLVGITLAYGAYNVFINTTDLSAGYYELVCIRWGCEEMYGARGFYLVNENATTVSEELNIS